MKRLILAAVAGVSTLAAVAPALAQPYGPPPGPAPAYNGGGYGGGMNQPGPGYGDRGREGGGYERDGRGGGGGEFWRGAPRGPWERVQWLQQRIERGQQDGSLNPREAFRAKRELVKTREYARNARQRYGQLRPEDRDYIQQRLDYVSQTIRWARHNDR